MTEHTLTDRGIGHFERTLEVDPLDGYPTCVGATVSRVERSTREVECSCGESFDSLQDGLNHLGEQP